MVISRPFALLFIFFCSSFLLSAEEVSINILLDAALARDPEYRNLESKQRVMILQERLEDFKEGFLIGMGTGTKGINFTGINKTNPAMEGAPTASLTFPEETGTKVEASLPLTYSFNNNRNTGTGDNSKNPTLTGSVKITQDLNALFDWEQQDLKKRAIREAARFSMESKFYTRKLAVEENLLTLIKELAGIEKRVITKKTELDEKQTTLDSKLRGELILRNGSLHLSSLMEIRRLEMDINESKIEAVGTMQKIERLTGIGIETLPVLPESSLPQLPESPMKMIDIISMQWEETKLEAELLDLRAPVLPKWSLTAEGTQGITSPDNKSINLGLNGEFKDFMLGFTGGYSQEDGFSLGAVITIQPQGTGRQRLKEQILEEQLANARRNREEKIRQGDETLADYRRELLKLENRQDSLEANRTFLKEYLEEMEGKYERDLIPEVEYIKAQDQQRLLDVDLQLLNLDYRLLNNKISSHFFGVE